MEVSRVKELQCAQANILTVSLPAQRPARLGASSMTARQPPRDGRGAAGAIDVCG